MRFEIIIEETESVYTIESCCNLCAVKDFMRKYNPSGLTRLLIQPPNEKFKIYYAGFKGTELYISEHKD